MGATKASTGKTISELFGDAVKKSRHSQGMSQMELARISRVSTRTIVDIERGSKRDKQTRQDVVIRLASALNGNIDAWMRLAGYVKVSEAKIERAMRRSPEHRFRGEIDPAEFFSHLKTKVSLKTPVLICVAYPSIPGALHRLDVQNLLVELFKKGLWVAMVCPYPRIREVERAKKPSLARHYGEVFGPVVELARELRAKITGHERQLAVFVPKQREHIQYVMPLAGLTEYRPTLIKYFPKDKTEDPKFALSAWVTLMEEKKDRWIQIYPMESDPDNQMRHHKYLCWRDYFGDILKHCDPLNNVVWKKSDFGTEDDWDFVELAQA